jgi:heme a synthase
MPPATLPDRNGPASRRPHRLAWLVACAAVVQIVLGGLVTTYGAGMAAPDWPTTHGHWIYPIRSWLAGSRELLLNNAHRMSGLVVLLLAIALVAVLWRGDGRRAARWLGLALFGAVVLQVTLGGLRVILNDRALAQVHACTAPLVFALAASIVAWTSPGLPRPEPSRDRTATGRLAAPSLLLAAAIYAQIVVGSFMRHPAWNAWVRWFEVWVWLKLLAAGAIAALVVWLLVATRRGRVEDPAVRGLAKLAAALAPIQFVLAGVVWVAQYGWPAWYRNYVYPAAYTVVEDGLLQATAATAHAAAGALWLGAIAVLWFRDQRLGAADQRMAG